LRWRSGYAKLFKKAAVLLPRRIEVAIPTVGKLLLNPHDYIDSRLVCFHTWEPEISAFIRANLRDEDVAVDIGANIGYYTLLMSRIVGKNGKVYSIEPCPPTLERLRAAVALNSLDNVTVVPCGISDRPERRIMTLDIGNSGRNSFGMEDAGGIELKRLGDVLLAEDLPRVAFIKIDVEGMEEAVLDDIASLAPKLSDRLIVVAEIWSDGSRTRWFRRFEELGFAAYELQNSYDFQHYAAGDIQALHPYAEGRAGIHDIALIRRSAA
jgi:FkbM family methyltransferase